MAAASVGLAGEVPSAASLLRSLQGVASGRHIARRLLSLTQGEARLPQQQLLHLVDELRGQANAPSGALAVQLAFHAKLEEELVQIAGTHPSHCVGVRAVTSLLRLQKAHCIQRLALSPDTSLSLARQTSALQALARCRSGPLSSIVTSDFLCAVMERFGDKMAAKLLARGGDESLVKGWWDELSPSMTLPAAVSLATRMPKLTLELLLVPQGGAAREQRFRRQYLCPVALERAVSVAVASCPDAATSFLAARATERPRSFFFEHTVLAIASVLLRRSPESACSSVRRWAAIPLPDSDTAASTKDLQGTPSQVARLWGRKLYALTQKQSEPIEEAWSATSAVGLRVAECDAGMAASFFGGVCDQLWRPSSFRLPQDQLQKLFALTLTEDAQAKRSDHTSTLLRVLLGAQGCAWHTGEDLDQALTIALAARGIGPGMCPATAGPVSMMSAFFSPQSLNSWPRNARKLMARHLASRHKPDLELAGAPPPQQYLQYVSHIPFAEAEAELKARSSSSNADTRQACMLALLDSAGFAATDPAQKPEGSAPDFISATLEFLAWKLKNEQDNVRAVVLQRMTTALPVLSWCEGHMRHLQQLLVFSLQAKGSSADSLRAWHQVVEVLVTSGLASLGPGSQATPPSTLGPCGDFGLEAMAQLISSRVWRETDLSFSGKLLNRLDGLTSQHQQRQQQEDLHAQHTWHPSSEALDWLVLRWLSPAVKKKVQNSEVEQACHCLLQWEGVHSRWGCIQPASLESLLQGTFKAAKMELHAWYPSQSLFRSALMSWPGQVQTKTDNSRRLARRQQLGKCSPLPKHLEDLQLEALQVLTRALARGPLMNFFAHVAGSVFGDKAIPASLALALEFTGNPASRAIEEGSPAVYAAFIDAIHRSFDRLTDDQRDMAASTLARLLSQSARQRSAQDQVRPSWERLAKIAQQWQFPIDTPLHATSDLDKWQKIQKVKQRLHNRELAHTWSILALTRKPARRKARRDVLESLAARPAESQAELLAGSCTLSWAAQARDPKLFWALLPEGACPSQKLQILSRLVLECQLRMHLLHSDSSLCGEGLAKTSIKPFLTWPQELQTSFAKQWLLPTLTPEAIEASAPGAAQTIQLAAAGVLLALPHADPSAIIRLVEYCTEVLAGTGTSSKEMALRGSAGFLLDHLMALLPAADMPSSFLGLVAGQIGHGTTKQAARSFQKLLRRSSPEEAAAALQTLLTKEGLKVAERVSLVRLLGTFVGEASVDLLVSVWQDGKCHRDVAGAVLVELCHPRVCNEAARTVLVDIGRAAQQNQKLEYPWQVLLQHLVLHPPKADDSGRCVLQIVGQMCAGDYPPSLRSLSTQVLAAWALQRGTVNSSRPVQEGRKQLAEQVANSVLPVLVDCSSRTAKFWRSAAYCLVRGGDLAPLPLQRGLRELLALNDADLGSAATKRLAALCSAGMDSEWSRRRGALDIGQEAFMELRDRAMPSADPSGSSPGRGGGAAPASVAWGLHLWGLSLKWSEPDQPVGRLQQLPEAVLSEAAFLPIMAQKVTRSLQLASPKMTGRSLEAVTQRLLAHQDEIGDAALVMVLCISKYVAEELGEGWGGWTREAVRVAQSKATSLPLKLLLLDVSIGTEDASSEEALAANAEQNEQAVDRDGSDGESEDEY